MANSSFRPIASPGQDSVVVDDTTDIALKETVGLHSLFGSERTTASRIFAWNC